MIRLQPELVIPVALADQNNQHLPRRNRGIGAYSIAQQLELFSTAERHQLFMLEGGWVTLLLRNVFVVTEIPDDKK